jgi:hypothetical protein
MLIGGCLIRRRSYKRELRLYHFGMQAGCAVSQAHAGPISRFLGSDSDYARAFLEPILANRRAAREAE